MDFNSIQSPLPERKLPRQSVEVEEGKQATTTPTERTNLTGDQNIAPIPPIQTPPPGSTPPTVTEPPKTIKKDNKLPLILGGIGAGAAALILFLLVILPKLGGGAKKVTTINYWGLWEDPTIIQGLIADYEAKNPEIKINYRTSSKTDYRTRLLGRLSKDPTAEEVPDIYRIHATWLPNFQDQLAPVPQDVAQTLQLDSDYYSVYKTDLKQNGQYMAIPLMYDGLALFYNQGLIQNGNVELPKSWWDLEQAANKLTVRDSNGKITVSGAGLGLVDNIDHWSDIVGLMLKQSGADIFKNDDATNSKIQNVLAYYSLFYTKYKLYDQSLPRSTELFANGKLAFYFAPSWRVFDIEAGKPADMKFGVASVPQLTTASSVPAEQANNTANLTNIQWASYWVEGVNVKSTKQKEAWKFLEYLASQEGLEKLYTAASQVRSFGEIYPRKSMASKLSNNDYIKPFLLGADNASSGYLSSMTHDLGINDDM
ncbi:MAG TPA: extracellular solute-binding protein, partial [Patescibacteria group bacterium]